MDRSLVRSGSSRVARYALVSAAFAGLVVADQILEVATSSITTYKAAATRVQKARPRPEQRAVNLDGSQRRGSTLPFSIAGNPFENVWQGNAEIGGIRLDTGTWQPSEVDIDLPAPGFVWGIGRSYNERQDDSGRFDSAGMQGSNWWQSSQPEIVVFEGADDSLDFIYLVLGADRYVEFQRTGISTTVFKSKNGAAGFFEYFEGTPDKYVLKDPNGMVFTFFGFDTTSARGDGNLWKIEDPAGNKAYVGDPSSESSATSTGTNSSGWDSAGRIIKAVDTAGRRYSYTYNGDATPHLTQVKVEVKTGGTWEGTPTGITEVARVDYTYYGNEDHGDSGDLKTVKVTTPLTDSGVNDIRQRYYRYYETTTSPAYTHALKYVYDSEGLRRYDYADSTFDDSFLGETDDNLREYAAAYFEYDSSRRVTSAWFSGQCGCGSSGSGTYAFSYGTSGYTDNPGYDNVQARRTVVDMPDSAWITQYFDEVGQPLSRVISDADPSSATSNWVTSVARDTLGGVTTVGTPESATYTHSSWTITDGANGLVRRNVRLSSGDLKGFVSDQVWRKGSGGTEYYAASTTYTTSKTTSVGGSTMVRPLLNEQWSYPEQTSTLFGSNATKIDYSFTTVGSNSLVLTDMTVTEPAVSTDNNGGTDSGLTTATHFKLDGTVDFSARSDGTSRMTKYRAYTIGKVSDAREDANTGSLSPPDGYAHIGTPINDTTTSTF
ncbi:MAG TPA: hypothetical protein VJO33_16410, partial [Gemmatimonadaceae bacterium]|nr:hypothetical protein [Gemmatimonadaceae bacterium]